MKLATLLTLSLPVIVALAPAARSQDSRLKVVPLKESKLIIEHNYTDKDTGFQGFVDSEGWKELRFKGPNGVQLHLEANGKLRKLGMTELFFETVEPENKDVPIHVLLSKLPAGNYVVSGPAGGPDAGKITRGIARLTHVIPKGATLVAPAEGSTVPVSDLTMDWDPVTQTINNNPVTIIAYQLIVEKIQNPHPNMIGKRGSLSMYVRPAVTQMTVPGAFLEPASNYSWEVLAIEPSGNQTLSSGTFKTQ